MIREECPAAPATPVDRQVAINRLMGLAVFGEMVAARTYNLMASLREEFALLLKKFASMEGQHATWFREACKENGIEPDKEFADHELDYLIDQVNDHHAAGDFDALAVVQGFIVESMAIAVYEPFLEVADQYPGTHAIFKKALDEELYHVDWVTRYLRLRFFDKEEEFLELAQRVNVAGIDCIGGSMMKIADYLSTIGLSGADCAGCMMDGYTGLLERVGIEQKKASKNVIGLFMPLIHKYRHGMTIK
jgi:rubrerythrin